MIQAQPTSPVTPSLAEDERWQTTQRIVDSPHFSKSPRLSRLLLYLTEQTLLDRGDLASEQMIAWRVFERDSSFNPAVDTIVRSHMVRLRQRLERYAEEEGATSLIRVSIPKGEYVVRFRELAPVRSEPRQDESAHITALPQSVSRFGRPLLVLTCLLGLLLLASVLVLLSTWRRSPNTVSASAHTVHPLWSRLFQPHQPTTFVAADSGLVLLHRMTASSTTLAEYLARDFTGETRGLSAERTAEILDMADRRYTSFVDMNLFRGIEHLPAAAGGVELKYARDLHMDDLKRGNFIFSGARGANPWLELYEPEMNFIGTSSNHGGRHTYAFINRHPGAGEDTEYSVTEEGANRRILGVLAFLSNLDKDGNVLIVEGDSMAGTEAISDFVFNDSALLPFLMKLRRPDGTLSHFEVLLEANSVNGSAGPFHILAYRSHP
jgi:hypothetical protein